MLDWSRSFRTRRRRLPKPVPGRSGSAARRRAATRLLVTPLEERRLLSGDGFSQPEYIDFALADVVGRHVFYNHSAFDGQDAAVGPADDAAIATDKQALLPGQLASFANYTSYSRGLNGLMVDVAGLPGTPTAADFSFDISSDPAGAVWTAAPAPQVVNVRRKAGVDASDRVTITWADEAIQGVWLRVVVQAAAETGLQQPDVFYFGNAIGETGNSPTDAVVDALDSQAAADNPRDLGNPAPITFAYDMNRDRLVDAADVAIVDAHFTTAQTALPLVVGPALPDGPDYHRQATEVFQWGDSSYPVFFGPTTIRTKAGSVLVFAEGRASAVDSSSYAIVVRRSTDSGATFSEPYTIRSEAFVNSGSPILDEETGAIFFIYTHQVDRVQVIRSDDDGLTWSPPVDITANVKVTGPNSPVGHTFPATPWGWYAIGPGHGIQLQHGPWAGRLIVGADHRYSVDSGSTSWSHVIYSDDHGQTWRLGGGFSDLRSINNNTNEVTLVERENGDIYMSMRIVRDSLRTRGFSRSSDGGLTWTETQVEPAFTVPSVAATTLRLNDDVVLFICSDSDTNTRRKLTVWASYDDTQTWVKKRTIFYAFAGYQDATVVGPDTVLVAFNCGHVAGPQNSSQKIGLARFNLRWLESDRPDEFEWFFNERAPGMPAETAGPSIADYSPWDNRAQARTGDAAPLYVAGASGDAALALSEGSDNVLLTPAESEALQFLANQSFTAQFVIRTTDADGVVLGTLPGVRNWTLRLVGGKPTFSLSDLAATPTVVGGAAIDDGLWHHVAVVRDAANKQLRLYVDRALAAAPLADATTGSLRSNLEVTLGQYINGTDQLALTIDTLRVTRGVVAVADFLPAAFDNAVPLPPPAYSAVNPTTIPGLRLWMPAYDSALYFADAGYADPLRLIPTMGDGIRSAIDGSGANWHITTPNFVHYEYDAILGPHVRHAPVSETLGATWRIRNSNGTQANNFDFVQNTGVFTISTFVKLDVPPEPLGAYSMLLDNNEATGTGAGMYLAMLADGQVQLSVSDGGFRRVNAYSGTTTLLPSRWYHVAAVASGPGNPVTIYVTPYTGTPVQVQAVSSTAILGGPNGNYPTDGNHDLTFAGRSRLNDRGFYGSLANQAIYDRALTPAEIQQLFDFGTEYQAPPPLQPVVTAASVLEDGLTTGGLIIRRNPGNGSEVTHFKIDQITGGGLYLSNGTTVIHNGDFITYAQGNAGLRFRPTPDSVAPGTFLVWASNADYEAGVGGDPAMGIVDITPVNDRPSFQLGGDQAVAQDAGPQVVPGWATEISAGPADEANQTLSFEMSTDNDALFAVLPQLSPDGTLTYTAAPGAIGSALVTVVLRDDGGTAHGGIDESAAQPLTISVGQDLVVAVVTTTADDGPGSLRQAILDVEAATGRPHRIVFAIPGVGPHVIVPVAPLPQLTETAEVFVAAADEIQIGGASAFGFPQFGAIVKTGAGAIVFGGQSGLVTGHSLSIEGGVVRLATGSGKTMFIDGIAVGPSAALDLADNDLVVHAGPFDREIVRDQIAALIAGGSAALTWNGPGIRSSAAAADPSQLTALGVMLNDGGFGAAYYSDFDGEPVGPNDVLVKYTYYGDADLSGIVDGTDYALTDNGFNSSLNGWFNGDFDYAASIDGTDYALIDNAFNSQSGPLAANDPVPSAIGPRSPASAAPRPRAFEGQTSPLGFAGKFELVLDDDLLDLLAGTDRFHRRRSRA